MEIVKNFIAGEFSDSGIYDYIDIIDPATGAKHAELSIAGELEIDFAINFAKNAQKSWANTSINRRANIISELFYLIKSNVDELANLIVSENGKTLTEAKAEISKGLVILQNVISGNSQTLNLSSSVNSTSINKALGVCVGITSFSFPIMQTLWMAPIAIMCGNAFILKPSEKTPSVSNMLASLWAKAGLPKGIFSVLHGHIDTVDLLITHKDVQAVSFIGSTEVAKRVYTTATAEGKRVQAFGGANNHLVVMPDAIKRSTVKDLIKGAFSLSGQNCMSISTVILVGENTASSIIPMLVEQAKKLVVGKGDESASDLGPIISQQSQEKLAGFIATGINEGAEILLDGRKFTSSSSLSGCFMGPTIFDGVTTDMKIYQKELFGPILCIIRANTLAEAINIINSSNYGNSASIYTDSGPAAKMFARDLDCAMIGINTVEPIPPANASFGGWNDSGFGSNNLYGSSGIGFYTKIQTTIASWQHHGFDDEIATKNLDHSCFSQVAPV